MKSYLQLARTCAKHFGAKCVSEQFSRSYNEESLRFTCGNGHNFFLSVNKLQKTHDLLTKAKNSNEYELNNEHLSWCNKCSKFYFKLKQYSVRQNLEVLGGLYEKRILMRCKRSGHEFTISYSKKLQQLNCLRCRSHDKELQKERLRSEEEQHNERLRLE